MRWMTDENEKEAPAACVTHLTLHDWWEKSHTQGLWQSWEKAVWVPVSRPGSLPEYQVVEPYKY